MFFTVSKAWHLCQFLEWKFIEFSGLFHCLIIKVQSNHRLPQSASPDCCAAFASDFVILTQLFFNVKHFFKKFFELFLSCLNCFKVSLIWNSFVMLPHVLWFVNNFFSNIFEIMLLNGEGGIWTLAPLLTTYSLSRGAPSAAWVFLQLLTQCQYLIPCSGRSLLTIFLAENVGFEPTVPFGITGFQDQPLKPLGQLSETVLDYSTTKPFLCQALFYIFFTSFFERRYTPHVPPQHS